MSSRPSQLIGRRGGRSRDTEESRSWDLVHDLADPRIRPGPVLMTSQEDHGEARLEGLAQHEAGLGQRTTLASTSSTDAIHHRQPALDLAPLKSAWPGVSIYVDR